jgi:4-hydroxybutyrate CoA-transferase
LYLLLSFLRGAALSAGGKPIIALPSVTGKGVSRIVPSLKRNAGVVTTRAHVDYIVTEYGIARLWGKTLAERHDALIGIAHPQHRDWMVSEGMWYCCCLLATTESVSVLYANHYVLACNV